MHDVIVVGAGPSGSYAAMKCAEKGLNVLLIDKEKFPRDKACGGIIGDQIVRMIGGDVMSVIECEASITDFYYNWKLIQSMDSHSYFIKRRRFDNYLVKRAVASGSVLVEEARVNGVSVDEKSAVVKTANGDLRANIVIGADGTNSIVAKSIGLSHHDDICRFASLKAEIDVTPKKAKELDIVDPLKKKTYFFQNLIGFAWIVPNGNSVNAGYGSTVSKAKGLKERFHDFLHQVGLKPQHELGAQIPFRTLPRVYGNRVLLTGDAGGFVNPWTGCGIEDGMMASEKAAIMCKMAVDTHEFSASNLSRYREMCKNQITRIKWRGSWIKALDRIMPENSSYPFWVEILLKRLVYFA